MKTFFDGIFLDKDKLLEEDIEYPIKIEYYETVAGNENVKNKYGIEIVKTEYKNENINVESKEIPNIIESKEEANKILNLLRDNSVTPIGMQDVLKELIII